MARSNGTTTRQLRPTGGGQLMPNWLLRRHSRTLLLLVIVSIAQTAAAQQLLPAETSVQDAAIVPVPRTNTAPRAKYSKPTKMAASQVVTSPLPTPTAPSVTWPVQTSLKNTLRVWAQRQGWPPPQFLTGADWAVDVPGSVSGSIGDALKAVAEGFSQAPARPRIEVTGNHVILVSEVGAE